MEKYLEMRKKVEDEIINRLEDLVNPENVVNSLYIEVDGIYGFDDWYRYTGSKIAAISVAAMIAENNETLGTEIYESILSYVGDNLISLTKQDLDEVNKTVSCVSFCKSGVTGSGNIYKILKGKNFFEELDSVYATLEIFTSMFIPDGPSLPIRSAEKLKSYYKQEFDEIDGKIRNNFPKLVLPLRRKKFQRNKYRALYENADEGYKNVMQLSERLNVEKIKQVIVDNDIEYLKP
ncbi:MAG: hypothetical protein KAI51_02340 [Candidatus Aenigmarchaeota archaeon]|nr:hypothetical protein [Candidatus Aenigmarchaeota archaeon]MCK5452252.1 hypothetical protein [Candidatus Aenigmarchaeota archaeon]